MAVEEEDVIGESVLDKTQRQYLRSLEDNPVWQSIIDTMARDFIVPTYRDGSDPHGQFYGWVKASGRKDERENMLRVLTNGKRGIGPRLDKGD